MIPAYERDPTAIYRESFRKIREEAMLDGLSDREAAVATRMIHACGMVDLADDLVFSGDPVGAGHQAVAGGAPILCDVAMTAAGIIRRHLPEGSEVVVTLNDAETPDLAAKLGLTRSAAAVDRWLPRLEGAVAVVGNAPTALFRLLEHIGAGAARPAAILAFPVGFVGAAESKQALIDLDFGIPFVTVKGRRGGSAIAGAAVNGMIAGLVEAER
ncbi:MAG: precorrin-8X methylmutase [Pseudomonadota bacterium]